MDKSSKKLLAYSLFSIAMVIFTIINIGFEIYFGEFNDVTLPDGITQGALDITKNFVLVVTIAMLLPQLYVGIKGACVAKNPDSSFSHIFLGTIFLIMALANTTISIIDFAAQGYSYEILVALASHAFEAMIYYKLVAYARKVRSGE